MWRTEWGKDRAWICDYVSQCLPTCLGGIVKLSVLLSCLEKANLSKKLYFSSGHSFSNGAKS